MSKAKRTADKTFMEKIGETVSHVKDIIVEKKDDLVDAVENKVTSIKKAIKKRKTKPVRRKVAAKKKSPIKKKAPAKKKGALKKVAKKSPAKKSAKKKR